MILQQLYFKTVTEEEFPAEKHQILDTEMFLGRRKLYTYSYITESRLHKPVLIWQVNGVVTVSF